MAPAPRSPIPGGWLAVGLCTVGYVGLVATDLRSGTLRDDAVTTTIVWFLVAFAGFLGAVWWNERHGFSWRWIWLAAILFRVLLLATEPTLSDDVYRYLWEGHLLSEGVSPWEYAINDPALDAREIDARGLANNPGLSSPYLPTAHAVFGAAALVAPSVPLTMQVVMVGAELAAAVLLASLLTAVGADRRRILLWLWNPLVVLEVAHGAHLDAVMLLLTAAALVATFHPRAHNHPAAGWAAPVLLALATLTRPLPALVALVLFWTWSWRQRITFAAVAGGIVGLAGAWTGLGLFGPSGGTGVFGSARVYSETFRFNSAIYQTLEWWVGSQGLDSEGWNEPMALTRLIIGALVLAALGWAFLAARGRHEPLDVLRWCVVPLAVYAVLTPVLHPWYILLLIALLLFVAPVGEESSMRWLLLAPWVWLAGALILSYLTYEDPFNHAERLWVRRMIWWPTLGLLAAVLLFQPSERVRNSGR
jgi:hypothetical protein